MTVLNQFNLTHKTKRIIKNKRTKNKRWIIIKRKDASMSPQSQYGVRKRGEQLLLTTRPIFEQMDW